MSLPLDRNGYPLRNTALEAAMREVSRHDSAQTRALLYQLFLDALVVVAVPGAANASGCHRGDASGSISVMMIDGAAGEMLPVFTNAEALLAWRPVGGEAVAMPARTILQMAVSHSTHKIVINPGSATWGFMTRREIQALAQGRVPLADGAEVLTEGTNAVFGIPEGMPPAEVMAALKQALAEEAMACGAWIFLLKQGDAPGEMAVAIEFAEEPQDPGHRVAMRKIVDEVGSRCEAARNLIFLTADQEWKAAFLDGSGVEVFSRPGW